MHTYNREVATQTSTNILKELHIHVQIHYQRLMNHRHTHTYTQIGISPGTQICTHSNTKRF